MSSLYLGEVFDIHGGGMDLVFPHHENERAQSWAATGREFVRVWMHNGFVTVGQAQEKMAKSLKNFFTIRDVISQYHPEGLRYFLLTTHYRSPINFTETAISEAENRVEYLYEGVSEARDFLARSPAEPDPAGVERSLARFTEAMDDDFNTAAALGGLAEDARALNEALAGKGADKGRRVATVLQAIEEQGRVLGLCERDPSATLADIQERKAARRGLDREEVGRLVAERAEARSRRDFAAADALRARLLEMGVQVMDSPAGTRWKVV